LLEALLTEASALPQTAFSGKTMNVFGAAAAGTSADGARPPKKSKTERKVEKDMAKSGGGAKQLPLTFVVKPPKPVAAAPEAASAEAPKADAAAAEA
jgi:hypothetical protein